MQSVKDCLIALRNIFKHTAEIEFVYYGYTQFIRFLLSAVRCTKYLMGIYNTTCGLAKTFFQIKWIPTLLLLY